jgi:hypothetical protein
MAWAETTGIAQAAARKLQVEKQNSTKAATG